MSATSNMLPTQEQLLKLRALNLTALSPQGIIYLQGWRDGAESEAKKAAAKKAREEDDDDGEAHTYDEWKELGYHVIRGEKATGRNSKGVATFTEDQVEENDDDDLRGDLGDYPEY